MQVNRIRVKIMSSRHLTPECWSVQAWGLACCRKCDYLATEDCGGMRIRKDILSRKYPKGGLPEVIGCDYR